MTHLPSSAVVETPLARVLARLPDARPNGKGYKAPCPAHTDIGYGLHVYESADGVVHLVCNQKCARNRIVAALDLIPADLYARPPLVVGTEVNPRPSVINEETGVVLYYTDAHQGGLYRPEDLSENVSLGKTTYIVTEETLAEDLIEAGLSATTLAAGFSAWSETFVPSLKGAPVTIIPGGSSQSKDAANQIAASLVGAGVITKVLTLPDIDQESGLREWMDQSPDDSMDRLMELEYQTPRWHPDPRNRTTFGLDEWEENPDWLKPPPAVVPKLAYRGLSTLLYLEPKGGKSTLVRVIAGAVSNGGKFLNEPCEKGVVLIVALEESRELITFTFQKFPRDSRNIKVRKRFRTEDRVAELRAEIEHLKPVLVIIDTFAAYARAFGKDLNHPEVEPVIADLANLAGETGVALLIIHHAHRGHDGEFSGHHMISGACDIKAKMSIPNKENDPLTKLRAIEATGRVDKSFFTMRFTDTGYDLAGSPAIEMKAAVTDWIRDHPGQSLTKVREGVRVKLGKADNNDIDRAVDQLRRENVVVNLGTVSKQRLAIRGMQVDLGDEGNLHSPGSYEVRDAS